jgi:hypothetical protein
MHTHTHTHTRTHTHTHTHTFTHTRARTHARRQLNLQVAIVKRMVSLGMTPILTAFAGHVPASLVQRYPSARVTHLPAWHGHMINGTYTLDPTDPLFVKIGSAFVSRQVRGEQNAPSRRRPLSPHVFASPPHLATLSFFSVCTPTHTHPRSLTRLIHSRSHLQRNPLLGIPHAPISSPPWRAQGGRSG